MSALDMNIHIDLYPCSCTVHRTGTACYRVSCRPKQLSDTHQLSIVGDKQFVICPNSSPDATFWKPKEMHIVLSDDDERFLQPKTAQFPPRHSVSDALFALLRNLSQDGVTVHGTI